MPEFEFYDRTSKVRVDDTDTFEVMLKVRGKRVMLSPGEAHVVADALLDAARDALVNEREHLADERERIMAGDDEITDHTGPNFTITESGGIQFASMRASHEAVTPPVTPTMRARSAETGVQARREGGAVSDAPQGVLGGAILRAIDNHNNGGGGDAA